MKEYYPADEVKRVATALFGAEHAATLCGYLATAGTVLVESKPTTPTELAAIDDHAVAVAAAGAGAGLDGADVYVHPNNLRVDDGVVWVGAPGQTPAQARAEALQHALPSSLPSPAPPRSVGGCRCGENGGPACICVGR